MGSLPDSKYIIQTDGYWFVEAHDVDPSKGYISVSARGIVNGLSNQPNDGADFGPDTYNPNYSGSGIPYTSSTGLLEAWNYAFPIQEVPLYIIGPLHINENITLSGVRSPSNNGSFAIIGAGLGGGIIVKTSSGYAITVDPKTLSYGNILLKDLYIVNEGTADGAFYCDESINGPGNDTLQMSSINLGTENNWGSYPFYINGFEQIFANQWQGYTNNGSWWDAKNINFVNSVDNQGFNVGYFNGGSKVSFTNTASHSTIKTHSQVDNLSFTNGNLESSFDINGDLSTLVFSNSFYSSFFSGDYMVLNGSTSSYTIDTLILENLTGILFNNLTLYQNSTLTVNYLKSANLTINLNGYTLTYNSGTAATTPSVPASGTAQSNTNPYPVNVYLYGGTVTVIDYTPSGGSATQVGTSGPATVRLNPGDSITLTYSGTPTWNWVAV